MIVFYWLMTFLIVGTFVPSALYLGLYAFTGEDFYSRRASMLWGYTRMFTLLGLNLLIWGHVIVAAWQLFH
jgi:hypothetical protein